MRKPESLQLRTLRFLHSRHDRPSSSTDFTVEDKIVTSSSATSVHSLNAHSNSQFTPVHLVAALPAEREKALFAKESALDV
jgi:hypothetical protein